MVTGGQHADPVVLIDQIIPLLMMLGNEKPSVVGGLRRAGQNFLREERTTGVRHPAGQLLPGGIRLVPVLGDLQVSLELLIRHLERVLGQQLPQTTRPGVYHPRFSLPRSPQDLLGNLGPDLLGRRRAGHRGPQYRPPNRGALGCLCHCLKNGSSGRNCPDTNWPCPWN